MLKWNPSIVQGSRVVVFGSTSPSYEALLLVHGAANVTVVEYNKLTYEHDRVHTARADEVQAQIAAEQAAGSGELLHSFDLALSISSFDHDGLGRYCDPLHPDADLMASDQVKAFLKPSGKYILAVPVGPDEVVWNLHRRYGALRLPLLLHGWRIEDAVGWDHTRVEAPARVTKSYEPVWLLAPEEGVAVHGDGSVEEQGLALHDLLSGAVYPPSSPRPEHAA